MRFVDAAVVSEKSLARYSDPCCCFCFCLLFGGSGLLFGFVSASSWVWGLSALLNRTRRTPQIYQTSPPKTPL